jgi:EAL domain-containing protein (putative c-di-GMP-specific phosphodiesterase class I)
MAQADQALYQAKRQGRNRIIAATSQPSTNGKLSATNRWANHIKDTIAAGQLVLALQPIVRLHDRCPVYYEALVRMPNTEGEIVLPGEFLTTAERFGLMPAIDRWVVEQVLGQLRLRRNLRIFVNLATTSFEDDPLLDHVEHQLAHGQTDPGQLGFEITETTAVLNLDRVQNRLGGLRRLGCPIALDDFGVGFTSFAELVNLPVDFVKIGQPFTNGWAEDRTRSLAIVRAIVQVAHALDKHVIAEAVESAEIAQQLHHLGVEYAQGFLFGHPSPEHLTQHNRTTEQPTGTAQAS